MSAKLKANAKTMHLGAWKDSGAFQQKQETLEEGKKQVLS